MRQLFFKSIAVCLSFTACLQASAAGLGGMLDEFRHALADGKAATLVDIDNDTLLLKKDDRFYTSGMGITRQYALPGSSTVFGWRIGQEQYTASDIKLPAHLVMAPDHPYAGWLYGGVFRNEQLGGGMHVNLGLDLGCLGPCAGGEWVQTNLHRVINQPLPQAWSKQVRNEFGVRLYADVAPARWALATYADLTPNLHARFGNIFTDAGAGLTLRAGRLPALPEQAAAYGFLRIDGRAVGYNASLQGGYFSGGNPHTVKPKRGVGEAELGMQWRGAQYGARISVVRRSNEIEGLPNSIGAQNFARLQFSYTP
jgi:lipid A 3-O-deacylase